MVLDTEEPFLKRRRLDFDSPTSSSPTAIRSAQHSSQHRKFLRFHLDLLQFLEQRDKNTDNNSDSTRKDLLPDSTWGLVGNFIESQDEIEHRLLRANRRKRAHGLLLKQQPVAPQPPTEVLEALVNIEVGGRRDDEPQLSALSSPGSTMSRSPFKKKKTPLSPPPSAASSHYLLEVNNNNDGESDMMDTTDDEEEPDPALADWSIAMMSALLKRRSLAAQKTYDSSTAPYHALRETTGQLLESIDQELGPQHSGKDGEAAQQSRTETDPDAVAHLSSRQELWKLLQSNLDGVLQPEEPMD